jgi:cytoskeletal protein RodZ
MASIGQTLREARMRQRLDIADVEDRTKIRAKYLRALENEEFAMLPGSTFVKTFLRTYAEYLGLDAQLLVEEFRAQHEPRGEGDMPSFAPPGRARPPRERRGGNAGMAIGPGVLLVAGILLILFVLAVIGLVSGSDEDGGKKAGGRDETAAKKKREPAKREPAAAPAERTPKNVRVKIAPVEETYLCIDDGRGTKLFEGTITTSQSFRAKQVRINLGRPSARIYVNGERFRFREGAEAVGFSFSRTGRATPLPLGDRPCA